MTYKVEAKQDSKAKHHKTQEPESTARERNKEKFAECLQPRFSGFSQKNETNLWHDVDIIYFIFLSSAFFHSLPALRNVKEQPKQASLCRVK